MGSSVSGSRGVCLQPVWRKGMTMTIGAVSTIILVVCRKLIPLVTYSSILGGIAPLSRVGLLRKVFVCLCAEPSDPEWRVECAFGLLGHRMSGRNLLEHLIIQGSDFPLVYSTKIPTHDPGKAGEFRDVEPRPMG